MPPKLEIYTASLKTLRGSDVFAITVGTGGASARPFAPTRGAEYALLILDKRAPGTNLLAQFFLAKEQNEKRKLPRLFESE